MNEAAQQPVVRPTSSAPHCASTNSLTAWLILVVVGLLLLSASGLLADGPRQRVRFENPFGTPHRLQPVRSVLTISSGLLPGGTPVTIAALNRYVALQEQGSDKPIPVQWSDLERDSDGGTVRATANYLLDLPAQTNRILELVGPLEAPQPAVAPISVNRLQPSKTIEVKTGRLGLVLAGVGSKRPPLVRVGRRSEGPGESITWRGRSKFINMAELEELTVERSAAGPVFFRQTNTYRFADGVTYRCAVTCWAGLDYLTAKESITGPAHERMRWLFDLEDWPTHVYTAGHGPTHKFVSSFRHSGTYLDFPLTEHEPGKELLWLPNYLIWSRFEDALLGCFVRSAAGPAGGAPFEPDMLMLFQIRRGEWEDDLWAEYSRKPLGSQPWQPWSQRRWWGSRFSTIRVARNGHPDSGALINFSLAPGTREWGIWMGDSKTLPPPRQKLDTAPLPSLIKTAAGSTGTDGFRKG